jgi:hypothetical protein
MMERRNRVKTQVFLAGGNKWFLSFLLLFLIAWPWAVRADEEVKQATRTPRNCLQCHTPDETILRGLLEEVSEADKTISLAIHPGVIKTVRYDEGTKLIGWKGPMTELPRDRGIAIDVRHKDGGLYAERVSVRRPFSGGRKAR